MGRRRAFLRLLPLLQGLRVVLRLMGLRIALRICRMVLRTRT